MREVTSPKQASGAGFSFETKVGAWCLLHLLDGSSPFDADLGPPRRVRFQTRVDGWLLDDVLLEFDSPEPGETRRVAVSVKSGPQFSGGRAPTDFVEDCWSLHVDPTLARFDASRDRLVLATPEPGEQTARAVETAVDLAVGSGPDLEDRILVKGWCNDEVRRFVTSFSCPTSITGAHSAFGRKIGPLLSAVRVVWYDFDKPVSESQKRALRLSEELVQRPADGAALWMELCSLAEETRARSGDQDVGKLVSQLRSRVLLKSRRSDRPAWEVLETATKETLEGIRDKVGASLRLERREARESLRSAIDRDRVVAVLGRSGSGKSALIRRLAESEDDDTTFIVLPANEIEKTREVAEASSVDGLPSVLSRFPGRSAVLALDAVDRVEGGLGFRQVASLLRGLGLGSAESPWSLVLSCQEPEWERVCSRLIECGIDLAGIQQYKMPDLSAEERRQITEREPRLREVMSTAGRSLATAVLRNLDLLARAKVGPSLSSGRTALGPSEFLEWYWRTLVEDSGSDLERGIALAEIARIQADERIPAVPIERIRNAGAVGDAARIGLVRLQTGTARPAHDLDGDYARTHLLLRWFESTQLTEIRGRVVNPLWHRAIAGFGLCVLDRIATDTDARARSTWRALLEATCDEGADGGAGLDLVFEALSQSADAGRLIERILPWLVADGGGLLRRCLGTLFLAVTRPHPGINLIVPQGDTARRRELEATVRVPSEGGWEDLLKWVTSHGEIVRRMAPLSLLDVGEAWRYGRSVCKGSGSLTATEAALCRSLVSLAWRWSRERGYGGGESEARRRLFSLCVQVGRAEPRRVAVVIGRLSGRKEEPERPRPSEVTPPQRGSYARALGPWVTVGPWPHGPVARVDRDFRSVAVSLPGALGLIALDADVARSTFLRVLIEEPHEELEDGDAMRGLNDLGLVKVREAYPPFHDFAPVSLLLAANSKAGIDLVLALVNLATERWAVGAVNRQNYWRRVHGDGSTATAGATSATAPFVRLTLDGESRTIVGDESVFGWHRGVGGPDVAASALMALEEWLYASVEAGQTLTEEIRWLLAETKSVAILGVLTDLALRHKELLNGPLAPLVPIVNLHRWSRLRAAGIHGSTWRIAWWGQPPERVRKAEAWHGLPHRKRSLEEVVFREIAERGAVSSRQLADAREKWLVLQREAGGAGSDPILDQLVALSDVRNWRPRRGGAEGFAFVPPQELREGSEQMAEASAQHIEPLLLLSQCAQFLEAGEPVEGAVAAAMLLGADRISSNGAAFNGELYRPVDIRCAAAAVAVKLAGGWLKGNGEWAEKCRRWLLEPCLGPPAPGPLDHRSNVMNTTWDFSCARVIPEWYLAEPKNRKLRRALATVLSADHDAAAALALRAVALEGRLDTPELSQELHLCLRFARLLALHGNGRTDQEATLLRSAERLREQFKRGRIGPMPKGWTEIAEGETVEPGRLLRMLRALFRRVSREAGPEPRPDGLDMKYLEAVFGWLAGVLAEGRRKGREVAISCLQGLASEVLPLPRPKEIAATPKGRRARYRVRSPFVARLAAAAVVWEADPTARKQLARPWLLRLPREDDSEDEISHSEDFLEGLYLMGLSEHPAPRWSRAALAEAFEESLAPEGVLGSGQRMHGEFEVALSLIGCGRFVTIEERWTAERAELVRFLMPHWKEWSQRCLGWYGCAPRFIRLATTPAAASARHEILEWLDGNVHLERFEEESTGELLARLLGLVADEAWERPNRATLLAGPFERLLRVLCDHQIPQAVLLARSLARGSG
jgi:hypothetical protein